MTHKQFTLFNLRPYYSSRFSRCQGTSVEFSELCLHAQNDRGGIVFYDRFAYLCKQKGVSVSRGAVEAGISKSLVTKWKTNNVEIPSPDVLSKLSKYFNLPISELLDEKTEKAPATTGERADILDEVDVAFYGDFKELDEDQKETVRDMVRVMRERRAKKQEK